MSIEVERILMAVRALSPAEQRQLVEILEKERRAASADPHTGDIVKAVRGKYADVPTSVDAFLARKHEELASEN